MEIAPERHAYRIASTLECTPSLASRFFTWLCTVITLIDSACATSCVVRPSASKREDLAFPPRQGIESRALLIEARGSDEFDQCDEMGRRQDQLAGSGSPQRVRHRSLVVRPRSISARGAGGDHGGADLRVEFVGHPDDPDAAERGRSVAEDLDRRPRRARPRAHQRATSEAAVRASVSVADRTEHRDTRVPTRHGEVVREAEALLQHQHTHVRIHPHARASARYAVGS